MHSIMYAKCHMYVLYAEYRYAECRYAECHYTDCHAPDIALKY
jgi:hypothetical protein